MSTDVPKTVAGSESDAAMTSAPDVPQLSAVQKAILERARETTARREAKPRKSKAQLLVVVSLTLALSLIAFFSVNYLVSEARRMIAAYAASKKEETATPPPVASGEPGVIILQPDRTLEVPATTPPAESDPPR